MLVNAEKNHGAEFPISLRQLLSESGHLRQKPIVKTVTASAQTFGDTYYGIIAPRQLSPLGPWKYFDEVESTLIDFHFMPLGFAGEFFPERTALGEQKGVPSCNCIRVVLVRPRYYCARLID